MEVIIMKSDESKYAEMAEKYKPEKVKTLFIAESPPDPDSKGDKFPYFYNPDTQEGRGLWFEMKEALGISSEGKEDFLNKFKERGYFLVDIFSTKAELEKFEEIKKGGKEGEWLRMKKEIVDRVSSFIKDYEPERTIFICKGATKLLSLHFPSRGWQKKFRKELRKVLDLRK